VIILEWDDENVDHVRAHNIEPEEIESIFGQNSKIYRKKKDKITQVIGATKSGRILFVVLEWLQGNNYRVVTAYDADVSQKRLYKKRGK